MRLLYLLLVGALLQGCMGRQLPEKTNFSNSSPNSLIVMSVKTSANKYSPPILHWHGVDMDTSTTNNKWKAVKIENRHASSGEALLTAMTSGFDIGGINYAVFEVEPGGYYLKEVTTSYGEFVSSTIYSNKTMAFVAEAGKAHYIGDFKFVKLGSVNLIEPSASNFEEAKMFMANNYENVAVDILSQEIQNVSLQCNEKRKNLFGQETRYCENGKGVLLKAD